MFRNVRKPAPDQYPQSVQTGVYAPIRWTTHPRTRGLEAGVTLLEADDARGYLHTLVADHLLLEGGTGYWIDCHGHATTAPLSDVASSDRILDRIEVARGFTPQQHFALVETLFERRDLEPGVIVAPAIDGQYRADELTEDERTTFLTRTLAKLAFR